MPPKHANAAPKALPGSSQAATRTELLASELKPHLSGSLWRLSGASGEWTDDLCDFVLALDDVIRTRTVVLIGKRAANSPEALQLLRLGPHYCEQRKETADDGGLLVHPFNRERLDAVKRESSVVLVGFAYRDNSPPSWTRASDLRETRWELMLFTIALPFVLISHTASRQHAALVQYLNSQLTGKGSGHVIERVPRSLTDHAFIGERTYNAILAGVHRPHESRVDKKMLVGRDLRKALDPYGDQTFVYVYGVAKLRLEQLRKSRKVQNIARLVDRAFPPSRRGNRPPTVGYGQSERTIVVSSCKDVVEFGRRIDVIRLILLLTDGLAAADPTAQFLFESPEGMGYLASSISSEQIRRVQAPFEAAFNPDLEFHQGAARESLARALQAWSEHGELTPKRRIVHDSLGGVSVELIATWDGKPLQRLSLDFTIDDKREIRSVARLLDPADGSEGAAVLDQILDAVQRNPVNIRFDSGHVFVNGQLYMPTLNEVLFSNWKWIPPKYNGKEYLMTEEKPDGWAFKQTPRIAERIKASRSLFSRVAEDVPNVFEVSAASRTWALLCNDQPEEVADFIFIDYAASARRLEFVHVKKAGNAEERGIGLGAYEEVVPQAVKNLRHANLNLLAERFDRTDLPGDQIGIFMVSSNGKRASLSTDTRPFLEFFERLKAQGPPPSPKVICYAPHVRKKAWDAEVKLHDEPDKKASRAAYMLSMLLLSAQADCARLNARFEVWSEKV